MSPAKTEPLASGAAQGFSENTAADRQDCASADADRKAFSTIQAAYALRGYALCRLADSSLVLERWGYFRALGDMAQAAAFLARIGGTP